jgi:hypothetical protein
MDKVYLAIVATGSHDDYHESIKFASTDKEKVIKWCDRFNRIVNTNTERMMKFNIYESIHLPFWYDFLIYYCPKARIKETKLI